MPRLRPVLLKASFYSGLGSGLGFDAGSVIPGLVRRARIERPGHVSKALRMRSTYRPPAPPPVPLRVPPAYFRCTALAPCPLHSPPLS